MKKLTFALAGIALAALVSDAALAQGGGGGRSGGYQGGGNHGGFANGGYQGGGNHGGYANGGYHGYYGGYYGARYGYGHRGWYAPNVGFYFGGPGYWGWGWGGSPYSYSYFAPYSTYYPYTAIAPAEVGVYSQAAPGALAGEHANQYWYYCTDPAGYYPHIQNCSKAWLQVVPQLDPSAPRLAPTQ